MEKDLSIKAFISKLEDIYNKYNERIEPDAWTGLVNEAYSQDRLAASVAVVRFVLSHGYIPSGTLKALLKAVDLRNHPAEMAYLFGADSIIRLLKECASEDPISYKELPLTISDDAIGDIVDSVEDLKRYLERSQIYMASQTLAKLRRYCPDNHDIDDLNVQYIEIRSTAGVPAYRLRKQRKRYEIERDGIRNFIRNGSLEQPVEYFERLLAEDYKNYEAYYCLGNIYILQDEIVKADYIADLLLDTGEEPKMAMLLKGRVLEHKDKPEDALFYYDAVCRMDNTDEEAVLYRNRVLNALEPGNDAGAEDAETDESIFIERRSEKKNPFEDINEPDIIIDKVESTDAMISRGRASEAYYELAKSMKQYPGSSLIKFKTAYALYLMEHEIEARRTFSTIDRHDPLYDRARYLIADIEMNISDKRRFEDAGPVELAEILFSSGEYMHALDILNNMDLSSLTAEAWSIKGRCEVEKGQLSNALRSFNKALEKDRSMSGIREIIAMLYQIKGDYDGALVLFDNAISSSDSPKELCNIKSSLLYNINRKSELYDFRNISENILGGPSDADGYAGMMLLCDDDKVEEGLKYLKRAIDSGSSVEEFYHTYAEENIDAEKYFRAMLCVERGIVNTGAVDRLFITKAKILQGQERYELAELITKALIEDKPESAELHFLLSNIKYALGDETEALKWTNSAVALDHETHEYIYTLAERYFRIGELDNALFYYTKAILLDETDRNSFKRRAYIFYKKNQDQKALDDINRAMLLNPNDAETYLLIGNILSGYEIEEFIQIEGAESAGDSETVEKDLEEEDNAILSDLEKDAEYYYTKAIMYDPGFVDGYVCRAKYYTEHGKFTKALDDIDAALAIDSGSGRLYMLRGIICHLAGKNEAAIDAFIEVSRRDMNNMTAYSYLIKCYNALGRYNDALSTANEALGKDKDFINIYVNRGVTYYHMGQYDDAIEDFNRVLLHKNQVNTAALEATYKYKGLSFEELGRRQDAITDFKMLLKYDPQAEGIKERITSLEEDILDDNSNAVVRLFRRRRKK